VLPIVAGSDHRALVCLGAKASGDIFTHRDMRILGILVAACEREWLRILKHAADLENEAKTNLLAEAGHDLRQPLHAVALLTDALQGRLDDPTLRSLVQRIGTSTRDLDEMLTSLLDRSRLDSNSIRPVLTDVALGDVFETIAREFELQARETGNTIRFVPTRRIVHSDRLLLIRVIRNLVSNALRYAPGCHVIVGARKEGDRVRIEIRDAGPGISREHQADIFAAFTQIPGGTRIGLGLGLSIVDGLARLLDHEIRLASEPGRGSTFAILVPGAESSTDSIASTISTSRSTEAPDRDSPSPMSSPHRVLIVEDDESVRRATATLLEDWGCDVREASQESEASSAIADAWRPDIVIADQHLGIGARGTDIVARLRSELGGSLQAIILMAETSPGQLDRIAALGDPVLRKPVRPARLRSLMRALLDR
jgi:CheY-like chemotaxis protein/nitrogen-specific signal transduction histidine kinase